MTAERFDLIVIGSGSGNTLITRKWLSQESGQGRSRTAAIIDAGTFGGTCLNAGCIPTKMFVYPAGLARSAAVEAPPLGVDTELNGVRWQQIRDRIFGRIDPISSSGRNYRAEDPAVTLIEETVRFTGPRTLVTSSGRVLEGGQIVIAAGSHPVLLDIPGADLPQVHTSETVMRIDALPQRMLVIGGGAIAAEFAAIFSGFGSEVTQLIRSPQLLESADPLISQKFTAAAAKQWRLLPETSADRIEAAGPGTVRVFANNGFAEEFDLVLIAIGRKASTAALGADFDTRPSGALMVNQYQQVLKDGKPVPGVWALGDITNDYQLKHVANHEARVVAHNMTHPEQLEAVLHSRSLPPVPAAVFTHPQIAMLGMTSPEAETYAAENGIEITEYVQSYGDTAYGWAMEDTESVAKVIAEKATGRLLGAHIIGPEASILIQPLIQAMSFSTDLRVFARGQYWIHPALTEVVENAVLGLDFDPLD
ncbi:mycothione reductase [Acaricomes phytoseiuli]|uniref:mycothione reductase n=1 Tax=Acaricomes phytoseiuli TaxID=291968 RepID=UPI00036CBB4D|nr:mycothione reductase [Acaricomes phytoseiuli]MCW1249261.1 mycothione reductase [Acaricomes phytoseiuli]